MSEETKNVTLYQQKDQEGNPVAPLVPERGIYDEDGMRLDDKLKSVNLKSVGDAITAGVDTIKKESDTQVAEVQKQFPTLKHQIGLDRYKEFNGSTNYKVGDVVLKEGHLYKYKVAHVAGAWNPQEVYEVSMEQDMDERKFDKKNIVQESGNAEDKVMSQKAVKDKNNLTDGLINISNYYFKYTLRDIVVNKLQSVNNRIVIELSDLFLSEVHNLVVNANEGYKVGLISYTKSTDTYRVIVPFTDSINISNYLSDGYFIIVKTISESNITTSDLTNCISMNYDNISNIHTFNKLYFVYGKHDSGIRLGYKKSAISKVLANEISYYKNFVITANSGYTIRLIAYKYLTGTQLVSNKTSIDLKTYNNYDYYIVEITRTDGHILYLNELENLVTLSYEYEYKDINVNELSYKTHSINNILDSIDSMKLVEFHYGDFTDKDFNDNKTRLHTDLINFDFSKYKNVVISPIKDTKIALCYKTPNGHFNVLVVYTDKEIDIAEYSDKTNFFIMTRKNDSKVITEKEFPIITPIIKLTPVDKNNEAVSSVETQVYIGLDDGNDNNDGTYDKPFKTIDKALSISNRVVFKKGTYENISINLSNYKDRPISIQGEIGGKTILMNRKVIINSPVSLYSTYKNVYSKSIIGFSNSSTIYQHLVNDEDTKIIESEINSYQRGAHYRCDCTKIKKLTIDGTTYTDMDSVLSYIESEANNNRFYYIYNNGVLYFSRPKEISSENCICEPNGLCINANGNKDIKISNLYCYYGAISFTNVVNATVEMCIVKYTSNWGCFYHNNSKNVKYIQCEAASNYYGSYGDGFNGDKTTKNDDDYESNIILIDCWAHDNNDDGYSTHYGCNAEIWGGLYEYNKKAGITPAQGTHCIAHNVLSRKNINGFYYILSPTDADDGINGNMQCFNCVADGNSNDGFLCSGVKGTVKNSILCVNCISIKNTNYGYQGNIRAINCKVYNNSVGDKTADVIVQTLTDL